MQLIRDKMPGVEEMILRLPPAGAGQMHVMQACALVWTARRAAARGDEPLADGPEWDDTGMRMELVR